MYCMYIVYIYIYVCKKKKKNTQGRVKNTGQHLFIPIYVHWPEESSGWTPVLCNTDCCLMGTLRPKTVILLIADTLYCEDGGPFFFHTHGSSLSWTSWSDPVQSWSSVPPVFTSVSGLFFSFLAPACVLTTLFYYCTTLWSSTGLKWGFKDVRRILSDLKRVKSYPVKNLIIKLKKKKSIPLKTSKRRVEETRICWTDQSGDLLRPNKEWVDWRERFNEELSVQ